MAYQNYDNHAFTQEYFSQYDSTISNGEARIPICFCIDTSGSMSLLTNPDSDIKSYGTHGRKDGTSTVTVELKPGVQRRDRIIEVQEVFSRMMEGMRRNPVIANSAVISVVTFDRFADCISEFSDLYHFNQRTIQNIRAGEDYTNASKGIDMALKRLDDFKRMNADAGNECYTPVLVFMSDGDVKEDPGASWARNEVRSRADAGKLKVISVAIGHGADKTWMRQLSSESKVYTMNSERELQEVFNSIAKRIERVAVMISVDEDISDASVDVPDLEDGVVNTQYGNDSEDFLTSALEDF